MFAVFTPRTAIRSPRAAQCPKLHFALSAMMTLLVSDHGRHAVMDVDGLSVIAQMLTRATATMHDAMSPSTVQLLYQLVFCLWCLSFNKGIANQMATGQHKVIPQLVHVAHTISKEKVSRVCLMTLKNLLGHGLGHANDQMVQAGIMKVLGSLQGRKWADEDIATDIDQLHASLEIDVASLSTFDVYKAEVLSGALEWSPSHKSAQFWKDNINKFSEGGYTLVSTLVGMLKVHTRPRRRARCGAQAGRVCYVRARARAHVAHTAVRLPSPPPPPSRCSPSQPLRPAWLSRATTLAASFSTTRTGVRSSRRWAPRPRSWACSRTRTRRCRSTRSLPRRSSW